MRKILTLAFFFLWLSLAAQEKISEQYVGWRGGGLQLHTISNKEFSCTFILALDSIKAFVLDNNAKIVQSFTLHRRGPTEKYLGGFIKNGHVYLYMDNAENPGLHTWLLNITDGSIKENIVPFKIKKNKAITQLSSDNHFFFLTLNKRSGEFVIYDFKDENHFDTAHYNTGDDIEDRISMNALSLTAVFNVVHIDMEPEYNIETVSCHNKIYVRNDSMILLNTSRSSTRIYEFDLANKKMVSRLVKHDPATSRGQGIDNSFLLDNKLYYVSATVQTLIVQVVDFYSGTILKEFHASADSEIAFKNTPIIQESIITRELGKTKQLLRKMISGDAVIVAYADMLNKQVQLVIGSYIQQHSASGPNGAVGGSWDKSARFKMLLDQGTNEFIPGELPPAINDRIETYNKGIKLPGEGENLFIRNDNYYYAFYDKEKRSFNVVKF